MKLDWRPQFGMRSVLLLMTLAALLTPLASELLQPVRVKEGTIVPVRVKLAGGGLVLHTTATAQTDGRRGDKILLQALDSSKQFSAEVVDDKKVIIHVARPVNPKPNTITVGRVAIGHKNVIIECNKDVPLRAVVAGMNSIAISKQDQRDILNVARDQGVLSRDVDLRALP